MNSLSRREFLGTAALLTAARPALAAETPAFTFAVITDTHLGRRGSTTPARLMQQAIEKVNASKAGFTLFGGDLVDLGHTLENQKHYATWLDLAKGLKKDWHAVPGNHDPREVFRRELKREHDWEFEHNGYRILGFADAGDAEDHLGHITPGQLNWLKERITLASTKSQKVILLAHVTAHPNKAPDVGWWVKDGDKELLAIVEANPHVVAIISGHAHCGLRGWSDRAKGFHEVIFPALVYNRERGLEKASGYCITPTAQAVTFVDVFANRFDLRQEPVDGKTPVAMKTIDLRQG